jgi:hypothetical protein
MKECSMQYTLLARNKRDLKKKKKKKTNFVTLLLAKRVVRYEASKLKIEDMIMCCLVMAITHAWGGAMGVFGAKAE